MRTTHVMTGGRYPVLRALGILYIVAALGAVCVGLYWVGWHLFAAPMGTGEKIAWAAWTLVGTFIAVVTLLAVAELIKLMIDIEHNTRMAANGTASAGTSGNGAATTAAPANRVKELDEESAEAALLRGH